METMKTIIWKQDKPKWQHQKQWTCSTSFNPEEIRQGKLFLMYWINWSTAAFDICVLPRTFFVNLFDKNLKSLITFVSKTGRVRWTGTCVSEMPFDKQRAAYQLTFRWKLCQGHPTTVFCQIPVRRTKYCLEFSITWGRLKISRRPFHSCTIFEAI